MSTSRCSEQPSTSHGSQVRFGATVATIVGDATDAQLIAKVPTMAAGAVTITSRPTADGDQRRHVHRPAPAGADLRRGRPNQFNPKFASGDERHACSEQLQRRHGLGSLLNHRGDVIGTPTATQIVAAVPTMAPGASRSNVPNRGRVGHSTDTFTQPEEEKNGFTVYPDAATSAC